MSVHELTRDQLIGLKQAHLCDRSESVSWGELAAADELIPDEVIFAEYSDTDFCEEDFLQ